MATPNTASRAATVRERARAELSREIKEEARRQLAASGADSLSLRAVAKELGMVSSALYRYYPSRDDLLTVADHRRLRRARRGGRGRAPRARRRPGGACPGPVGRRLPCHPRTGRWPTRTSTR